MMMEMMFQEMNKALGFEEWWESESEWDGMAEMMVLAGLDENEVEEFFDEMAWEL